ncbi:MAG TPA: dockerin type I domain-containing protein, partial [Verrucomicrobiae bacterium]|nr:dockerin type I domain-containing protein [Verrucomicrobiae bacterium]
MSLLRHPKYSGTAASYIICAAIFFFFTQWLVALPQQLGDLNEDGEITVLDLVRLLNHVNRQATLTTELSLFADVNQDGLVNQSDAFVLADIILGASQPQTLPPTRIRETSPPNGASSVAVTRETVFRFSQPLGSNTFLGATHLYAEFGGRKLLSRIELSSDRRTVTLFYLENLPGGARVRVTFDPIALQDFAGRLVDVDGDGQSGGVAHVDFDTAGVTPLAGTGVIGTVYASDQTTGTNPTNFINRPLQGVTITVDGMEETLRTITDSNGFFRLQPAPAGEFFVHIDGRTLTNLAAGIRYPDLSYYPFVGKVWTAAAGSTNNPAGGTGLIYLPLITQGTLRTVSMTNDTTIGFPPTVLSNNPSLAGVSLTVPANSLFSASGARGGSVGIAPVPPDRLPGPLPTGLNLPLVITVQTSGAENFDRPVPVRFPNLPDPVTGKVLPSGAVTALWSFNHDIGEWEVVGSMTVSEDGLYVDSDPGVGIRQPGWHGTAPGVGGNDGKIRPKKKKRPCQSGACDDGDDCTSNDTCQSGECSGTPLAHPGVPDCGPSNAATPIDMSSWTETFGGTDTVTTPQDVDIQVQTCFDAASGTWKQKVASMKLLGNINFGTDGYIEVKPGPGGNVNEGNYCAILNDLIFYIGGGRGRYSTMAAEKAHEYYHRDKEYPAHLKDLWPAAEAAIESASVPCNKSGAEADALLQKKMDKITEKLWADFEKKRDALRPAHNRDRLDGPYEAGQDALNPVIDQISEMAAANHWAPCPNLAPLPAALFGSEEVRLIDLEITPSSLLLSAGETASITIVGRYSDGTSSNLTLSGSTSVQMSRANIATASPGAVSALSPGVCFANVRVIEGNGADPALASIHVTVRSPDDFDNDGLPDVWERAFGLNPKDSSDGDKDADGDGVTNAEEYRLGTHPRSRDSDADGVSDGQEMIEGSNPTGPAVPDPTPQTGLHYYLLLDLDNLTVERGIAGKNGVAFRNLILAPNTHYRQFILQASTLDVGSSDFTTPNSGAN